MIEGRRIVAKLISTKQPISHLQLCMIGVKVNLAKVGYQGHPDIIMCYIVPICPPKTRQQLLEEILDILSKYSIRARNMPQRCYQRIRQISRLIRRMGR